MLVYRYLRELSIALINQVDYIFISKFFILPNNPQNYLEIQRFLILGVRDTAIKLLRCLILMRTFLNRPKEFYKIFGSFSFI